VGQTYTKYNKINNNSENFRRGKIATRGAALWPPLVAILCELHHRRFSFVYFMTFFISLWCLTCDNLSIIL